MSILVYLLFIIIIAYSAYQIFVVDKRSFSLNKFLWFYVFLFWGIAPLAQYAIGIFNWDVRITNSSAIRSNLLVLLFLVCYRLTYRRILKTDTIDQKNYTTSGFQLNEVGTGILIILQLGIFLFFTIKSRGLVFLRGETNELIFSNAQPIQLIVDQVSRALSTLITFLFFWQFRQDKSPKNTFFFVSSLTLMILTNFPLALPRYMAGAFYVGLLFVSKPIFKKRSLPIFALIFVFLIIFPAVTVARYITSFSDMEVSISVLSAFTSGDFDNFSTLNMAVLYVDNHGITWGNQLFGVLLFFVPRSIWPTKPVGSGHHMAMARSMDFTNLSCPIVAEGYLNFGFLGTILFAIIIGIILSKLDSRFYHHKIFSVIHLMYPLLLGLIIFILRGDLMSSWAYTVSFIIAAYMVFYISKPFIHFEKEKPKHPIT